MSLISDQAETHQRVDDQAADVISIRGIEKDGILHSWPWQPGVTNWSTLVAHIYPGRGTEESPFLVDWLPEGAPNGAQDMENPIMFTPKAKWIATAVGAVSVLAVTMASSMLSAAIFNIMEEFPGHSEQLYIMITSAFVLGFVVGPTLWAPMSEVFGRRTMFLITYIPFTLFNAGVCGAPNLNTLLVLRFLAGTFGASSLTNTGGIIADMFNAAERGRAMGLFAAAPFLGPAIGPIAGGFLAENASWRWVGAVITLFSALLTGLGVLWLPETYGVVLLRRRAARLSKQTGLVYRFKDDVMKPLDTKQLFISQLSKPWELLYKEPIVLLMAIYIAIVYAILYMQFASFPIVFQLHRGWSPGIGGLAFLGITIGALLTLAYMGAVENPRYVRKLEAAGGYLPPEERLPAPMIGSVLFPAGLIWFAWTCSPNSIHWIVPIVSTVFYGAGLVMLFLGLMSYLVDTYLIYAASVMAGNTIIRSLLGVILPLFTSNIFEALGLNWGNSLIALIAAIFLPAPYIFYFYGKRIRRSSPYARKADDLGELLAQKAIAARNDKPDVEKQGDSGISRGIVSDLQGKVKQQESDIELALMSSGLIEAKDALGSCGRA